MKLIKQSFEILEQEIPVHKIDDYSGSHFREQYIQNMYKHIERCGRTCYKSEDRITEGSAERFVNGLIKTKHYSVLEHGVVYLRVSHVGNDIYYLKYVENPYSIVKHTIDDRYVYITTNYRVIVENGWEDDLQYLCEPTEYHEKRHTVLLHSCIHVYKDLTRHRKMSFSIESTRYCNYSKTDKFGEMKFVAPPWINSEVIDNYNNRHLIVSKQPGFTQDYWIEDFVYPLETIELTYNNLIKDYNWKQEQAAEILPQCTAADVVMSGFASDWEFVFLLRSKIAKTGAPHPLVEELITPLMEEFIKRDYVDCEK